MAKYKETVKVQALIRLDGELRLVQAATEGQVMSVAVKGNQVVKKGDAIATINDSRLQTKKRSNSPNASIRLSLILITELLRERLQRSPLMSPSLSQIIPTCLLPLML